MAANSYLSVADFKVRVRFMRPEDVDQLEAKRSGVTLTTLEDVSEYIDTRLDKRYATPFVAPLPRVLFRWVVDLATPMLLEMRGFDANDPDMLRMAAAQEKADAQILEAASSKDSLFGLPATDGGDGTGISRGGPLFYSEASPYVGADRQEREGVCEDLSGFGTYGGR